MGGGVLGVLKARFAAVDPQAEGGDEGGCRGPCAKPAARRASCDRWWAMASGAGSEPSRARGEAGEAVEAALLAHPRVAAALAAASPGFRPGDG